MGSPHLEASVGRVLQSKKITRTERRQSCPRTVVAPRGNRAPAPTAPQRTKSSSQVHNNLKEQLTVPQEHSGEEASKSVEGGAGKKRSPSPSQPPSSTQKTGTLK